MTSGGSPVYIPLSLPSTWCAHLQEHPKEFVVSSFSRSSSILPPKLSFQNICLILLHHSSEPLTVSPGLSGCNLNSSARNITPCIFQSHAFFQHLLLSFLFSIFPDSQPFIQIHILHLPARVTFGPWATLGSWLPLQRNKRNIRKGETLPSSRSGGRWGTGVYNGQREGQECETKGEEGEAVGLLGAPANPPSSPSPPF